MEHKITPFAPVIILRVRTGLDVWILRRFKEAFPPCGNRAASMRVYLSSLSLDFKLTQDVLFKQLQINRKGFDFPFP